MKQASFKITEKAEAKDNQSKDTKSNNITEKVNTEKIVKNTDITTSLAPIKKPIKKVENIYYL